MNAAFKEIQVQDRSALVWMTIVFVFLVMIIFAQTAQAKVSLKAFESDSMASIEDIRQGEAFVMVLWSIECPPCLKELKLLSKFKHTDLSTRFILVSTDGEDYRDELEALINVEGLAGYEHWLFKDSIPERLRYKIDPTWYGELPRAYFYDEQGERIAHSGVLTEEILQAWLIQYAQNNKHQNE